MNSGKTTLMKRLENNSNRSVESILEINKPSEELSEFIKENYNIIVKPRTIRKWRNDLGALKKTVPTSLKRKASIEQRETYNTLVDIINEISSVNEDYKPKKKIEGDKESIILCISDSHVGKKTEEYNTNVAKNMIESLSSKTLKILDKYLYTDLEDFDSFNIFFLGDIIDGELIYDSQIHHIESSALDQVRVALKSYKKLINALKERFEEVNIHCVRGNHGRGEKGRHEESNWDLVFYYMLRESVRGVNFNISKKRYGKAEINGQKILFRHGDDVRDQVKTSAGRKLVADWEDIHDYDCFLMGHYHFTALHEYNSRPIFRNGSFVLGDNFAEQLARKTDPYQWLFGVSENRVPTFQFMVDF